MTTKLTFRFPKVKKGGPGSGHHGHSGRPGKVGGSSGGSGGISYNTELTSSQARYIALGHRNEPLLISSARGEFGASLIRQNITSAGENSALHAKLPKTVNPYDIGTEEHSLWNVGYERGHTRRLHEQQTNSTDGTNAVDYRPPTSQTRNITDRGRERSFLG